jgi:hypothetical protein
MDVAVLIGVLLISLLIAVILTAKRRERERQDRIARWAAEHGWSIMKNPSISWIDQLPSRQGRIPLLVYGSLNGLTVGVAEYTYTTVTQSTGPNGQPSTTTITHALLVTAVRLPHRYPAVAVVRRGVLSRLSRAVFGEGATATGNAEFDRRFRIRTRHPDVARALIGPAVIVEHLADYLPTWSLADQDLLTWREGRITDPGQIPALVEPLMRVAYLLASTPR